MGIFDFVKQGVQEMLIVRPEEAKDRIVWKHPERTIPNMAQLTVAADEAAVFFRDGSLVGSLRTAGAGQRHTLSSQNIPFLGRLVDNVTGGNIWTTDLFFVTMRPILDQRFGGELGYVEDPLLGEMVTPRIYGSFAFQILDPERFITAYVGVRAPSSNEEVTRWITGLFMNSVKTVVGNVCVTQQKSMLEIMPMQQQIAQSFEQACPDLNNIGVKITQVGQFNIKLDDADEQRLREAQAEIGQARRDARKAQIAIQQAQAEAQARQFELDQDFQQDARYVQGLAGGDYSKFAAGKMMMGAGEGMAQGGGSGAGGDMMAGASLGAGFGMAQAFAQGMNQGNQPQPPQQQAAPAPAPAGGNVTCSSCNASVPGGKFCAECGSSLAPPQAKFCPGCGAQGTPGAKFCAECGTGFPA